MIQNNYKKHFLKKGSTIREALSKFDVLAKDAIVFIVGENNQLVGSLTDGDVRRGLLKGFTLENKVDEVLQSSPRFIKKGEQNIDKVIEYRNNDFRIIPVLDNLGRVVNVVNFNVLKSYLPIDAVIMAGGRGERLRPLTDGTPKPLLLVGDKPILGYNMERLISFGIDDFWISVNYLANKIEKYVGDGKNKNLTIKYIKENKPLGTIGSLAKIQEFTHEYILITNSDLLTNINYELFFLEFLRQDADLAVVTIPYKVSIPYAVLETNNGHVIDLKEKPTYTYYSNGGIYLVKKEIVKYIPKNTFYDATDLMELLISDGKKVISYPFQEYWLDVGSHEDYQRAQNDIKNLKL